MSRHLQIDLERLERQLILLAGQVEEAVRRATTALLEARMDLGEMVIEGDEEIDRREVELEEDCLKILALHQPVATDLRFVAATLKINNDLERIGDLAVNIAERAISLATKSTSPVPSQFRPMMEQVAGMLRRSIRAFVAADVEEARNILVDDLEVDAQNRQSIKDLLARMHESPGEVEALVQLFSVSKNLERIGDHATNIAEDVVYMVEGDIIRHQ